MQQATDRLRHPRLNLVEEQLGINLAAYVGAKRAGRTSWRRIASDLRTATGVTVSGEAVRLWWATPQTLALAGPVASS